MSKGKKGGGKKKGGDEDWDAILNEMGANNPPPQPIEPAPTVAPPTAVPAEADESGDDSDDNAAGGDAAKKDNKRKKKKKAKKDQKETEVPKKAPVLSAAARAALEHKQRIAEEEERIRKLREAEEERIRQEEARIAEEQRLIEEEKARKRKAKQDKVDAQKAAGTYMTKTEKERHKRQQEKLEQMKKAGLLNVPVQGEGGAAASGAALYRNNKKNKQKSAATSVAVESLPTDAAENDTEALVGSDDEEEDWEKVDVSAATAVERQDAPEAVTVSSTPGAAAAANAEEDDDEDWEQAADDEVDLSARRMAQSLCVEDQIELDQRREQERLKAAGLERQRREEEARRKREEEEQQRAELEKAEREAAQRKEAAKRARIARDEAFMAARSLDRLRAPISCIMGHVDTGKTKLLDKIRHTNVQEGEAGGITQQIGATHFPRETLLAQTAAMQPTAPFVLDLPGLLVIDTPGHEAFTNLRSRGSSLCDIAILVVDLMHGLEQQTIESLNLLRRRNTPFIVALNKVDRCYGWKVQRDAPIREALAAQDENVRFEFQDRTAQALLQLNEQGLNAKLYWENDSEDDTVSVVPTSAVSGEGVPDLMRLLLLTAQTRLRERLMYSEALQCTVLEVKAIEGLGHTVDVVLVNGSLREGDRICVSTMDGPVITNIRALLTPPPNREMRIKSEYVHHAQLSGAMGVKIVAPDIGRAVAGTPLLVLQAEDDDADIQEEVQSDLSKVLGSLQTEARGVMVHASTLGALEALLHYLKEECKPPIPVAHVNIGPIHKRDVLRASIMHEKNLPQFATILAFDVPIDSEAREQAEELKVKVFFAEIIYHLFDQFSAYMRSFHEAKKAAAAQVVVFPSVLKIFPNFVFNKKDPIVLGVEVLEGTLRVGTPLHIPQTGLDVGRVTRIEINHREVQTAKKGQQVAVRIENESNPTLTYGRQFDHTASLYSKISRASIDACKEFFADEMTKEDWALTIKLKKLFNIM